MVHQQAKEILKTKWNGMRDGKSGEYADLIYVDNGVEILVDVQVKQNWIGRDFPYEHITLPAKRSKQIERGFWFVMFNTSLTRFALIRSEDIKDLPEFRDYINIPLEKVGFHDV